MLQDMSKVITVKSNLDLRTVNLTVVRKNAIWNLANLCSPHTYCQIFIFFIAFNIAFLNYYKIDFYN